MAAKHCNSEVSKVTYTEMECSETGISSNNKTCWATFSFFFLYLSQFQFNRPTFLKQILAAAISK